MLTAMAHLLRVLGASLALALAGCTGPLPFLPADPAELPPERLQASALATLVAQAASSPRTYAGMPRCVAEGRVEGRRFAYLVLPERCGDGANAGRPWQQGVAEIPLAPFLDAGARAQLTAPEQGSTMQGHPTLVWSGKATMCTNSCDDNPRHLALVRIEDGAEVFYMAFEADQRRVRRDDFVKAVRDVVIDT